MFGDSTQNATKKNQLFNEQLNQPLSGVCLAFFKRLIRKFFLDKIFATAVKYSTERVVHCFEYCGYLNAGLVLTCKYIQYIVWSGFYNSVTTVLKIDLKLENE